MSQDAVRESVPVTVTRDVGPRAPARLRGRGRRLWRQLVEEAIAEPGPGELLLIEEACRLADRLDRLDAIVNGAERSWLTLELAEEGVEVTVIVDKVLTEARQQQIALKQIVSELRQAAAAGAKGAPRREVGTGVADLTARIADRRRQASG